MNKRLALAAALCLVLAAGITPGSAAPAHAAQDRPNILIVLTDDQRTNGTMRMLPEASDWFGRGTKFTNAFAPTPLCCPARGTLFSGRYAHNHGVKANNLSPTFDHSATMQRHLQDAGYRTALFGKLFNDWQAVNAPPYWSDWAVIEYPSIRGHGYYDSTWNVNGAINLVTDYTTHYIQRKATRFLDKVESDDVTPWLMVLSTTAPHAPYTPEERYRSARVGGWRGSPAVDERDLSDKPRYIQRRDLNRDRVDQTRRKQLRTLLSVDDMVGAVRTQLRKLGEDDTLAIFLSDNGFLWGEHGWPNKRLPYTESIQIPLYARWPGHLDAGASDPRLVGIQDITPTVLDAAGVNPGSVSPPLDGRSLLDGGWSRPRMLFEYWEEGTQRIQVPSWASTRTPEYQYIETYGEDGHITFREYYRLAKDPWMLENVLADGRRANDPNVDALQAQLDADRTCVGSSCP